jgi:hypothetical protein
MSKQVNGRKRAIIAKIVNYNDTETVKIAAFTALNGQTSRQFGVSELYPKEDIMRTKRENNFVLILKQQRGRTKNDQNLCMTSCMLIERNLLLQ